MKDTEATTTNDNHGQWFHNPRMLLSDFTERHIGLGYIATFIAVITLFFGPDSGNTFLPALTILFVLALIAVNTPSRTKDETFVAVNPVVSTIAIMISALIFFILLNDTSSENNSAIIYEVVSAVWIALFFFRNHRVNQIVPRSEFDHEEDGQFEITISLGGKKSKTNSDS